MKIRLLFLLLVFLNSCTAKKELSTEEFQRLPPPMNTWKYEDGLSMIREFTSKDLADYSKLKLSWFDGTINCDPDSSYHAFPVEGPDRLYDNIIYPRESLIYGEKGKVRVVFTIDTLGIPGEYRVFEYPSYSLGMAVLNSINSTYFVPGFCNGKPKKMAQYFTIDFNTFVIGNTPTRVHRFNR
ncbi:MAG TPA: hypothetical protein DEQ34_06645 [Balneolaceae bacterium]|nr:hypothetical protein [Balneolaceae bacterium]|tara:strand:- start:170857 stop:171405 length:549 start_codon:yes stop_codon:yes gene_type:complete